MTFVPKMRFLQKEKFFTNYVRNYILFTFTILTEVRCRKRIDGLTLEGALWVIRARFQGNKAVRFSPYFRSDFKFGNETHTVCGVTSFQGFDQVFAAQRASPLL